MLLFFLCSTCNFPSFKSTTHAFFFFRCVFFANVRFVPNGGRIYYTERSQPPLLSDMVCEIYSARPDPAFLARALPSLASENFVPVVPRFCCSPQGARTEDHGETCDASQNCSVVWMRETLLVWSVLLERW